MAQDDSAAAPVGPVSVPDGWAAQRDGCSEPAAPQAGLPGDELARADSACYSAVLLADDLLPADCWVDSAVPALAVDSPPADWLVDSAVPALADGLLPADCLVDSAVPVLADDSHYLVGSAVTQADFLAGWDDSAAPLDSLLPGARFAPVDFQAGCPADFQAVPQLAVPVDPVVRYSWGGR